MTTCVVSYEKPEEENKAVLSLLGEEIQLKSFKKNILENGDQLHLKIIILFKNNPILYPVVTSGGDSVEKFVKFTFLHSEDPVLGAFAHRQISLSLW